MKYEAIAPGNGTGVRSVVVEAWTVAVDEDELELRVAIPARDLAWDILVLGRHLSTCLCISRRIASSLVNLKKKREKVVSISCYRHPHVRARDAGRKK